jgi:type I restriction enzyme M protein
MAMNKERILRRLERERFVLPADCRFDDVYTKRNDTNLGEVINKALEQIEEANKQKLMGVFRNIDCRGFRLFVGCENGHNF